MNRAMQTMGRVFSAVETRLTRDRMQAALAVGALGVLLSVAPTTAATYYWVDGATGSWTDSANWSFTAGGGAGPASLPAGTPRR